jgi:hypothetical protein
MARRNHDQKDLCSTLDEYGREYNDSRFLLCKLLAAAAS